MNDPATALLARIADALERLAPPAPMPASFDAARLFRHA
ncbi:MAG: AAA family ATPase, partial [Gemmatimonadaceae bacterium]|nr:AAA family ATPase [Caulobacter sp.]